MTSVAARYDGHAEWYDENFYDEQRIGRLVELIGLPPRAQARCLDVGCGTGFQLSALLAVGFAGVGIDISHDQLKLARRRCANVVRADGARLPFDDCAFDAVVSTFTHTDVEDFASTLREMTRVLAPNGRLIYVGLHPCYVGTFFNRHREVEEGSVRVDRGYGNEALDFGDGRFILTSRVGRRSLTLTTLLQAFLEQRSLRIDGFNELDTNCNPWTAQPSDGRVVPWNIAVVATKTADGRPASVYGCAVGCQAG